MTPKHYLTEAEAAEYIGYRPVTLRAWRREGRGPAYLRIGRSIRYPVPDLDHWLASHRIVPRVP